MDDEPSLCRRPPEMARPQVLAVDDHPSNLLVLSRMLQKLDVDVVTADSGQAAIDAVQHTEFAAILLDVQMPDMDGYETARRLSAHLGGRPTPIIFITAIDRTQAASLQGYASGAIDFLYKPIDQVLLTCKLTVLLELYRHRQRLAETTRELGHVNRQMTELLRAVGDGIIGIAADGRIDFANPAACALLQANAAQLVGQPVHEATRCARLDLGAADSAFVDTTVARPYRTECHFYNSEGRELAVEYVLSTVPPQPGEAQSWVLVFHDISERQQAFARLREQAERDPLTGLANRAHFNSRLSELLAAGSASGARCALLFVDLDGFKMINDRFGHACGDELLVVIAQRLRQQFAAAHFCARLGGDEFGVLVADATDVETTLAIGHRMVAAISEPHPYDGRHISVGASVGVALYPDHAGALAPLLRAADLAMYAAKARGRGCVTLARPLAPL